MRLQDKVAIVTGASRGLGAAIATELASEGCSLTLVGRTSTRLDSVKFECQKISTATQKPLTIAGDLTQSDFRQYVVQETLKRFSKIDILVNNAGIMELGSVQQSTLEAFDKTFDINFRVPYDLCRLCIPHLKKIKGCIINMSSIVSVRPNYTVTPYAISKAAMDQLTVCLAAELGSSAVRVVSINPGVIPTNLWEFENMNEEENKEFIKSFESSHALNRNGTPREVAKIVAVMASDVASFISGSRILVDGGMATLYIRIRTIPARWLHCPRKAIRLVDDKFVEILEKLSWSVGVAITEFAQASPPGIYKADYLRKLFTRYGDSSKLPTGPAPTLPLLPDWYIEFDGVEREYDGKRSIDYIVSQHDIGSIMSNNSNFSIPARWLYCPRKAVRLVGEKFLPFKTPLNSKFDDQIPPECLFQPSMMLSIMRSYNAKLGLWIDLTNTDRFYDKMEIESRGISYIKLPCRGHNECPTADQTREFINICANFISKHPTELIGIHCTHGFNRTGFLIVSYLVEKFSWSVRAAIAEFAEARPTGIYKEEYLLELFTRYGDPSKLPILPPLPEWCNEGHAVEDKGRRRGKEFDKSNPSFMDGVKGMSPITHPKLLEIQRRCQDMCEWRSTGFPGLQPVSINFENLAFLQKKPYKVSWKADGTRYMMLIDGANEVYFLDRDNCVFQVSNLRFPRRKFPDEHVFGTLVDGEMVIDRVDGKALCNYLVYDIVKFENQEVGKTDFDRRMFCIRKELVEPRQMAKTNGLIDRSAEHFSFRMKEFWDVSLTRDLLSEKFTKQLGHEVDGLVYQPMLMDYSGGPNLEVLKWKPPSLNSVDFKLVLGKEERPGMLPGLKGLLFVGKLNTHFAEIKVTKELESLDQKIIECKVENNEWIFMRERTDKSFPNSHKTAISVCNSIRTPITKERLLDFIDNYRWQPKKRPLPEDNCHSSKRRKH
uniref:mRNA guanylyltransferase n=1 Tax=Strigamia maritima TaxID=126957 RepID=T1J962_STRMM